MCFPEFPNNHLVKQNPLDPTQWIEQLLGAPPFVLGRVDAIEAVGASWVGKVGWTVRGRGSFDLVDLDAVGPNFFFLL
jgi:hypothetical protein